VKIKSQSLTKKVMNKIATFCILTVLSFNTVLFGQTDEGGNSSPRNQFSLGIKAGLNFSNVWDSKGEKFEADGKTGLAAGLFLGIPIGKYIGFQPEVLVSQKGFKGSGILLGQPYSMNRTLTYFDVPLQLQIKPIKYLTILLGPQYSYLFHEKSTYTLGVNSVEQEKEFTNDNIRKNILGFVAGADINLSHIVLSGRVGLDITKNNGDGTSTVPRYKNQWAQFTIGFKI
jgi:hypothetical protein